MIEDSQPSMVPLENKKKAEEKSQEKLQKFLKDSDMYQTGNNFRLLVCPVKLFIVNFRHGYIFVFLKVKINT